MQKDWNALQAAIKTNNSDVVSATLHNYLSTVQGYDVLACLSAYEGAANVGGLALQLVRRETGKE